MKHLNILKILNMIIAIFVLLAALAATAAMMMPAVSALDTDRTGPAIGMIAGGCVLFVFLLVLGILFWMTGKRVAQGRWRIMQTVLTLFNIANFPIGFAYAIYALWVCWMNEETKEIFAQGGLDQD